MPVLLTLFAVLLAGIIVWTGILVDENNRLKRVLKKAAELADPGDDVVHLFWPRDSRAQCSRTDLEAQAIHADLLELLNHPNSLRTSQILRD